jgi:putative lipoic acid-binding regulatory protein
MIMNKYRTTKRTDQKLLIEYPCRWLYKIIGSDQGELEQAVQQIISGPQCTITVSRSSSSGKYISINCEVEVYSEENRNDLYMALKQHPAVTMVL